MNFTSLHCINPDCPQPYPQPGNHKFCQRCGTTLRLNNRYIPLQRLGVGGFAAIYTVWDLQKQKEKVLKVLTITSEKALQLFIQEAIVLRSLHHTGVPKVEQNSFFEVKTQRRKIYCLAMEKIIGQNLETILNQSFPNGCPEDLVCNWLRQATTILEVLHRHQVVHRDLKPSNLMLRIDSNQVVLIDFGGAKQINRRMDSSTRLFSSGYSPPEQIVGSGVKPATDIYALGRTAIHLLTGKHPSELEDINTGELDWRSRVKVHPNLANLLDEMTRPQLEKRIETARKVRQRLDTLSTGTIKTPQWQIWWRGAIAFWETKLTEIKEKCQKILTPIVLGLGETFVTMILAGAGAILGASLGYLLIEYTLFPQQGTDWLNSELPHFIPGLDVTVGPEIVLFAFAGGGTGWSLMKCSQNYSYWRTIMGCLTGFCGYILAWGLWEGMPYSTIFRFWSLMAIATISLSLCGGEWCPSGLGWIVVLGGVGGTFWGIIQWANLETVKLLTEVLSFNNWSLTVGFCGTIAIVTAFFLGLSYYLIKPLSHWWHRKK